MTRPKHWLEFATYQMANRPLKISIEQTHQELNKAWTVSYSSKRTERALESLRDKTIHDRVMHLVMRIMFRGIYFPQINKRAWLKTIFDNRRSIYMLAREGFKQWRSTRRRASVAPAATA